jgi:hypothetical protein
MAKAIVLVGAHHTSQQADPTRVLVLRGGIGLPRRLIVSVIVIVVISNVVVAVVVVVVIIVLIKVHGIAVARTSTGLARSTSRPGRSTTTA